jgi:signal peptidase I
LVVAYLVARTFSVYEATGPSMENTIHHGDWLITRQVYASCVMRGDIVVFHIPDDTDSVLVKRVLGVQGDRLRIHHGELFIEGVSVDEPYVHHQASYAPASDSWPTDDWVSAGMRFITVPAGNYFVLGDNREASFDSRGFGTVRGADVVGVVVFDLHNMRRVNLSSSMKFLRPGCKKWKCEPRLDCRF